MNRYAVRYRDESYRRYLEEVDDERERSTRESEWRTESGARHRRVISKPGLEGNQTFQTYDSRTPIKRTELRLLKPGDHIGWRRPYIIWHHAIVVDTDFRNRKLLVIHFTKVGRKAVVAKQWINVDKEWGTLFRFDYSENITDDNPPEDVLERAERRIGEEGYDFISKNCEHFATFCKTGREDCHQVQWALGKVKNSIHTGFVNGRNALAREIGKQTYRSMAESSGKVAVAEGVELIGRASNLVGAGLVAAFETAHCIYDVHDMYQQKKAGKITERDFRASATERVGEGVVGGGLSIGASIAGSKIGGIAGSWLGGFIGGVVGSLIPVVGTAIGAAVGSAFGGVLGNVVGGVFGGIGGSILGKALGSLVGRWFGRFW